MGDCLNSPFIPWQILEKKFPNIAADAEYGEMVSFMPCGRIVVALWAGVNPGEIVAALSGLADGRSPAKVSPAPTGSFSPADPCPNVM